jgi:hypothetical protein
MFAINDYPYSSIVSGIWSSGVWDNELFLKLIPRLYVNGKKTFRLHINK